jgi:hypothetical protein
MTTPHQAIAQGIFDIVVERGSQLKQRATDESGLCAYRDGKGGMCFVGLLLSDEETIDSHGRPIRGGVNSLVYDGTLPGRLLPHTSLLTRLQGIHDTSENWLAAGQGPDRALMGKALREVAHEFGLKTNTVDAHFSS